MRIEPPMSEPIASVAIPAANAAAEPPDDPPGVHSRFHGLRVTPQRLLQVTPSKNNSGAVVCACRTAPAATSLSIPGLFSRLTSSLNSMLPEVIFQPLRPYSSFTAIEIP